jgi:hypothetical protein
MRRCRIGWCMRARDLLTKRVLGVCWVLIADCYPLFCFLVVWEACVIEPVPYLYSIHDADLLQRRISSTTWVRARAQS